MDRKIHTTAPFRASWLFGKYLKEVEDRQKIGDVITNFDVYQREIFTTSDNQGLEESTNVMTPYSAPGSHDNSNTTPRSMKEVVNTTSSGSTDSLNQTANGSRGSTMDSQFAFETRTGSTVQLHENMINVHLKTSRENQHSLGALYTGLFAIGKEFMEKTTAHGIPRVVTARSMFGRLIWTFIFICALMAFLVQASFLVTNYSKFEVTNKINVKTKPSLDFPGVTVCNTNKLRRSAIAASPHKGMLVVDDGIILPYYSPCISGDFACANGLYCIKQFLVCDGVRHCVGDNSDELGCVYGECGENQFRCASGSERGPCIPKVSVCDRNVECYEGEDENDCDCKATEYKCKVKGGCLSKTVRCDGRLNCLDGSDEDNCPDADCYGGFLCDRGSVCIADDLTCDGSFDCEDRTDENDCQSATMVPPAEFCLPDEFRCNSGHCITLYWKCDGGLDCPDGSDEYPGLCSLENEIEECQPEEFLCDIYSCKPSSSRCDGYVDCFDKTDEEGCPCDGFRCESGKCIDDNWVCDDYFDCEDEDDESDELCDIDCNQSVNGTSGDVVSHSRYPNNYQNNMMCTIIIDTKDGGLGAVQLEFLTLNVEFHPTCDYDYVQV
ncbi:uncharacterized protein LOC144437441 [Glandiceps talaboti]